MRVVSREVINRDVFIRGLVPVLSFSTDTEDVYRRVVDPLSSNGYQVDYIEHLPSVVQRLTFVRRLRQVIASSRLGVIVLSKVLLSAEFNRCLQMLYYEIGLLEGHGSDIYPLFLDATAQEYEPIFKGKPIANIQGVSDIEQIIDRLTTNRIPREIYFSDRELNRLVLRRIRHVRLTVIMDIWRSTLEQIWRLEPQDWDEYGDDFNDDVINGMLEELFTNLRLGVIVHRFGKDETFEQEAFAPYMPESQLIDFDSPARFEKSIPLLRMEHDLEERQEGAAKQDTSEEGAAKQDTSEEGVAKQGASDSIVRTLRMEFYIPVHDVLGTSYTPYMALQSRCSWAPWYLRMMLEHSGKGLAGGFTLDDETLRVYEGAGESRLYFTLPGYCTLNAPELCERFGRHCNFIFPK